jgi:hypothetical protein
MSLAVALVFILVGVARAWNEFDTGRVSTWIFVIGMAALSLSVVSVYVVLESRRHRLALGPDQVARSSA